MKCTYLLLEGDVIRLATYEEGLAIGEVDELGHTVVGRIEDVVSPEDAPVLELTEWVKDHSAELGRERVVGSIS